jgi:hypothetical protein
LEGGDESPACGPEELLRRPLLKFQLSSLYSTKVKTISVFSPKFVWSLRSKILKIQILGIRFFGMTLKANAFLILSKKN